MLTIKTVWYLKESQRTENTLVKAYRPLEEYQTWKLRLIYSTL